jgi:hypothetical protein
MGRRSRLAWQSRRQVRPPRPGFSPKQSWRRGHDHASCGCEMTVRQARWRCLSEGSQIKWRCSVRRCLRHSYFRRRLRATRNSNGHTAYSSNAINVLASPPRRSLPVALSRARRTYCCACLPRRRMRLGCGHYSSLGRRSAGNRRSSIRGSKWGIMRREFPT